MEHAYAELQVHHEICRQLRTQRTNVELDGEAYFEVAKNKNIPFYVHTETNKVKVVGTSFNVCAYSGSHEFGTTLVEGIVDIYPANSSQIITRLQKDEVFLNENGKCRKAVLPSYEYLAGRGTILFDDSPPSMLGSPQ